MGTQPLEKAVPVRHRRRLLWTICFLWAALAVCGVAAWQSSQAPAPTVQGNATPTRGQTVTHTPTRMATPSPTRPVSADTPTATATRQTTAVPPTATTMASPTSTSTSTSTPLPATPTGTPSPTMPPSPTPSPTITVVLAELPPTATPNLTSQQEQLGSLTVWIFVGFTLVIVFLAMVWMLGRRRAR